ncbi:Glutathione S-transferase, C-terminal-like [Parasponia andersonii]|uniref:Glutathione S-transferase, C-terminal-like n=1 Tax=Parasponia andersonii TaxID=3476 RepID=A0A2P5C8J2_PARAD|nr:Glutathione S-transferase, C-terminal-like [Parasponia andersonii]
MWSTFGSYRVLEEIIGRKLIDPEEYPLIFSWVTALNEVPLLKELSPPHEKLLAFVLSLLETFSLVFFSYRETQEKAVKELYKKFRLFEEGIKGISPDGFSPFDGKSLGLLDILMCTSLEESLGVKVIDPEKNPLIFSWVTALCEISVVKELIPAFDEKLVQVLHGIRNNALNSHTA